MAKVGIVMGSDSDMPVMSKAADILEQLGVEYEMTIISAHREPDVFFEYARGAEEKGFKVIIAGSRQGGASSGHVCGDLSDAGDRDSYAYDVPGRAGFPVFDCADAKRDSGGDSGDQRRRQRSAAGCKNTCGFR